MRLLLILAMSGLAMACAHAAPPVQTAPDEIEIVGAPDEPQAPLTIPEQPAALVAALKKLQEGSLDAQVKALIEKARQDMVYVEGGEFLMGDFGHLDSVEKLPYTSQPYNKPLHKVVLDSFSISKYKVTYAEYDVYTKAKGLPLIETKEHSSAPRKPSVPAGVPWQSAKDYCVWLGKVSTLPFDLPTEAQWEYAARARGQFLVFPTNDGYYREDVNVSSYRALEIIANGWDIYPIGLYPANPLGVYDLAGNGNEWMNDWFGENTYKEAAHYKNPTGPQSGTKKVVRGLDAGNTDTAMSMYRRKASPIFKPHVLPGVTYPPSYAGNAFRCALQQPKPIP